MRKVAVLSGIADMRRCVSMQVKCQSTTSVCLAYFSRSIAKIHKTRGLILHFCLLVNLSVVTKRIPILLEHTSQLLEC